MKQRRRLPRAGPVEAAVPSRARASAITAAEVSSVMQRWCPSGHRSPPWLEQGAQSIGKRTARPGGWGPQRSGEVGPKTASTGVSDRPGQVDRPGVAGDEQVHRGEPGRQPLHRQAGEVAGHRGVQRRAEAGQRLGVARPAGQDDARPRRPRARRRPRRSARRARAWWRGSPRARRPPGAGGPRRAPPRRRRGPGRRAPPGSSRSARSPAGGARRRRSGWRGGRAPAGPRRGAPAPPGGASGAGRPVAVAPRPGPPPRSSPCSGGRWRGRSAPAA